jgi:hypothetical protein
LKKSNDHLESGDASRSLFLTATALLCESRRHRRIADPLSTVFEQPFNALEVTRPRPSFLFQVRSRHVGPRLSFLFQVESEMAGRGAGTGPNVDQVLHLPRLATIFSFFEIANETLAAALRPRDHLFLFRFFEIANETRSQSPTERSRPPRPRAVRR